jgi:hypothetical protein
MTPEREPVDDAALIAEVAETLLKVRSEINHETARNQIDALLAKLQPPAPEPDRATLVTREVLAIHEGLAYSAATPCTGARSNEYLKGRHDRDMTFQAARAVIAKALKPDVPSIPGWLHDWARKALSGIFIYNPNISDEVDKQINDTMRAAEQIDEWAKVEKQLIDGAGVRAILRVAGEKM